MKTVAVSQAELLERLERASPTEKSPPKAAPEDQGTQVIQRKPKKKRRLQLQLRKGTSESLDPASEQTLAELIDGLLGSKLSIQTDLSGRLKAWPRLKQGDRVLSGTLKLSEIDSDGPLELCWIPNEEKMVELVVRDGEQSQRLLTPMATAVPVAVLLAHLVQWLELEGERRLYLGERPLGDAEILADLDDAGGRFSLRIERVGKS